MLYRKISKRIENHLLSDSDRVLVIDGARQIGKSFIVREVGRRLFPNYIEVNMESDKVGDGIFAGARTVDDFYLALSTVAGDKMGGKADTLVFIDEIQAYDHLLTLLKFLREDGRFTIIASGSLLGVTLKLTSSIPLGSIDIVHMYPLDFEEFMIANGIGDMMIQTLGEKFQRREALPEPLHQKVLDLFRKYLLVGGLPEAVNEFLATRNIVRVRNVQSGVHHLYGVDAARYEATHKRLKIQRIYGMIPSNLENKKKRMVAKDIENKTGTRMSSYADEFDYLIASGIALEVKAVSKPCFPLMENSGKNLLKLYMNDVGLLTGLFYGSNIKPVIDDVGSINLGSVYESVVAQELRAHGFDLYYYDNKKIGEVDYLIDDMDHMSVLPLEIKSGKDYQVHRALDKFMRIEEYKVHDAFVFSNAREVEMRNGITYMPIYYVSFLQKTEDGEVLL